MEYNNPSDSSGTDDDPPPPSHTNRVPRGGRPSGNGRAAAGSSYGRPQIALTADQQIRKLELDAYTAVLRAFGAQAGVLTWAKEGLLSNLRKELRVPDEQHRELLTRVSVDEAIGQIREWKQLEEASQPPSALVPVHDPSPSPAVSQSRKKQKTSHVTQTPQILPPPPPPPLLKPAPNSALVPSPAPSKRGVPVGPRGKKSKGGRQPTVVASTIPKMPGGPPAGRGASFGRGLALEKPGVAPDSPSDHHVGRRVKTRWPDDNTFYEAVITDYDPEKGMHALVYDMGTSQETWEWVNLKEMSSSDMKWVDAPTVSLLNKGKSGPPPVGRGGGRGLKRGSGGGRGGSAAAAGRARGAARGQAAASTIPAVVPISQTRSWRGPSANENGLERKGSRTLQIPVVEPLLKEAENLKDITDTEKLELLKGKVKAHGEALRTALVELGESSEEAGSDDGAHGPPHMRIGHRERVNRSLQGSRDRRDDTDDEEDTAGHGRGVESDGEQMVEEGGGSSDGEGQLLAEEGDEEDEDG